MQIQFFKNKSFEIRVDEEHFQFWETEELSYTFVEHLSQFRLEEGNFSFSFPFDMITLLFEYQQDGTIIIGTEMYDETERRELIVNASDFFPTFCQALFDYFKHIEENMPLEKYVLDNNPQRNKSRKWKWEMYVKLKKNYNNLN